LLKVRLLIFSLSAAFPTVFLIWPDEEEVLKLWQGLGYYSRANLHKTAQYVAWELAGVFPDNYSDLLKLKLVSIPQPRLLLYNEVVPVVTECVSVLSRYFDVETDIALASAKKRSLFFELMPKDNPATLTRRLWSSVLCNAYLKVQIVVFACLTIVAALQKKVDQLPVNLS
jgi:A/G-specific adenine glycosylase